MTALEHYTTDRSYYSNSHRLGAGVPGECGLSNLGNTCFMNSMLQCLSAAEPFTRYFIGDGVALDGSGAQPPYLSEINRFNPLGSRGRLAHAYGALMRALWSGKYSSVSPDPLKKYLSDKAPQFCGYNQHDSQEFMAFLLDNLLEDLCRSKVKPPGKEPLGADRPEVEQADHTWQDYIARNGSAVTDVFSGQFRSQLTCNKCAHESVTFDPFASVSVPIPIERWDEISYFFAVDRSAPPFSLLMRFKSGAAPLAADVAQHAIDRVWAEDPSARGDGPRPTVNEVLVASVDYSKVSEAQRIFLHSDKVAVRRNEQVFLWLVRGAGLPWPAAALATKAGGAKHRKLDSGPSTQRLPNTHTSTAESAPMLDSSSLAAGIGAGKKRAAPSQQAGEDPSPSAATGGPVEGVDFVRVWLRQLRGHTHAYWNGKDSAAEKFVSAGDMLVVSLRCIDGVPLTSAITNAQVHAEISRKLRRFILGGGSDLSFRPYTVGFAPPSTQAPQGWTPQTALLPDDDAPFVVRNQSEAGLSADFTDLGQFDKSAPTKSNRELERSNAGGNGGVGQVTLKMCFDKFAQREQLGEEDTWYCSKCKAHVQAFKEMKLWRLPKVLIVHLKRFQQKAYGYGGNSKLTETVHFPSVDLDVSSWLAKNAPEHVHGGGPSGAAAKSGSAASSRPSSSSSASAAGGSGGGPVRYDLFAVSEHFGGMGGGHYTASVENFKTRRWQRCDDYTVSPLSSAPTPRSEAYVLFYKLRAAL
jgi:ubiquitin C-terminal hydrolase